MALKLVRRPWGRQPIGAAGINWGHPRAEGLAFFAPLSGAHGTRDLVQEQLGVRTGLEEYLPAQNGAIYHRFFSANRADFPLLPLGIGLNTPFTIAWTQEPRSGSAYSALLVVNFGTAGTDHQFTIYQSTSDASYSMVTGPLGAGSSASNTPRFSGIGVATNERLDRFVLQCSGGSQSVTTGDYVLWRNGERFTTSATAVLSAYRTAAFRIGALSDAGDPFEGLIGDMRMWSRVLSDGEAEEESTVHGSWALFEPQRIWVPVASAAGADFTFSGSGGIQFSGAATAQSTASFSVSGSGGLQFAGAATNTFTNAFSVSGSGGLSFGGTASGVYTTAWAASGSGGLQFGGAAGASSGSDYAVTGAGGITFAGAAAALNSADFSMSATGGLLFAGAAAAQVDAGFAATGSGGLLFGGAAGAVTSPTFAFSGGGGLLLGGDAAQACTTVYSFTASGGMLLAGAATASMSTGGGTGATVDDIWNGILLEASLSPADMLRIILAAVSGKTTGIGTDSEQYLSVDGSKARVAATFDGNGNRQAVTLDGSA